MATVVNQTEQYVVLHDVSWATYEHLLADHLDCSSPHFTYDRGTLEIMSPSMEQEEINRNIGSLIDMIVIEWGLHLRPLGSMTFKREDLQRGFEPDSCFYIQHVKSIKGKRKIDLATDPPPDLVIEIDITSGSIDKLPLYAALGIPEVWRYVGDRLLILALAVNNYVEVEESLVLPRLTGAIIVRFIEEGRKLKRPAWLRSVREWARSHRPV
jgi:Uma2 family endonuclease